MNNLALQLWIAAHAQSMHQLTCLWLQLGLGVRLEATNS